MTIAARLVWLLVIATGLAAVFFWVADQRGGSSSRVPMVASLLTVALALLSVGLISHTVARHTVQILPVVLALGLSVRKSRYADAAAVAVFLFWLLIMAGIWLFLLGIASIFSGRFSPAEVVLTLIIGCACIAGLFASAHRSHAPVVTSALVFLCFSIVQLFAMWSTYSVYWPRSLR